MLNALPRVFGANWEIENQIHWVLDVDFNKDDSRIHKDHAPENLIWRLFRGCVSRSCVSRG